MQVDYRLLGPLEAVVDGRRGAARRPEAARDARAPPLPAEHRRPGIATRRRPLGRRPAWHRRRTSSRATSPGSARRSAGRRSRRAARGYVLHVARGALDLQRFERLAHEGSQRARAGRSRRRRRIALRGARPLARARARRPRGRAGAERGDRAPRGAARPGARAAGGGGARTGTSRRMSSRSSSGSCRTILSASGRAGC